MAVIKSTIVLDDKYSSKAKEIASSTNAMGEAMKKSQSVAKKMGDALKSAFAGKHEIKINEVGSKEAQARIRGLQVDLDSIKKGKYQVKIETKDRAIDKIKNGLDAVKNKAKGVKSSLSKFKVNTQSLISAKKDAWQLGRELTKTTGKRHKIKIDLDKPDTGGFISNLKSKLSSGFSKLNPMNWFGGRKSGGGGSKLGGFFDEFTMGNLKAQMIMKGAGAVKGLADQVFGSGMSRLENIQSAKARLRGQTNADGSRKFDDAAISNISNSAMNAVQGTAYGFGDAMTTASSAIAAGVKQENLGGYLKDISNIAAATGSEYSDIGAIMNKIQTTGKLQGDELMQLSDRGLPMLAKIAELKGVDQQTAREMISKGEISADDAFEAASKAAGNSAEEMNKTWGAAKMNFQSALSKLGAGLLGGSGAEEGGVFEAMTPALLKVNDMLNDLVPTFQNVGDAVKDFASSGIEKLKSGFGKVSEFLQPAMESFKEGFANVSEKLGEVIGPLKEKFITVFDGLKEAFSPLVESISNLFGDAVEGNFSIFPTFIDLAAQGLGFLADAIMIATPIIQSVVEWISANIIPVISELVSWISGTLIPAIGEVVSTVMGVLIPIFQTVSEFISSFVLPAFEAIANTIISVAEPVFHAIASAVEWATGKFNDLVGAVGTAVDALLGIPGKIAGMVGDAVGGAVSGVKSFLGIGKNATGTSYFGGGMTQINERGEEMIQLARGDKIYPAGKTEKIIKNDIKKNYNNTTTSQVNAPVTMNIYTNDEKKIVQTMDAYFKRLGVLV